MAPTQAPRDRSAMADSKSEPTGSGRASRAMNNRPPRSGSSSVRAARQSSAMRGTSADVAGRAPSTSGRARLELRDSAEDRLAAARGRFVGADGLELVDGQTGQPLDDLRGGQRVVPGNGQIVRGRGRPVTI